MARPATGRTRGRTRSNRQGGLPLRGSEIFARPESNRYLLIVGFIVRRRTELTVITVGWLVFVQLNNNVTPGLPGLMTPAHRALLIMTATLTVVLVIPASRRFTVGRLRAGLTRHRMRACFPQTRTWTANGRLPFLLWSRPSCVGERVRVWLPAGLSVKDLERVIDELAAACWAREARITPVRGQAALVLVDIVRRDPLGSTRPLTPPVVEHLDPYGACAPDPADRRHPVWTPVSIPLPRSSATPQVAKTGSADPASGANGARVTTTKTSTTKAGSNGSGAARGTDGPADPPAVTGFGGVDVTDYV